jgi:thiamine pyrophosphate-dependent acetolactate synthase large subunit-like protein
VREQQKIVTVVCAEGSWTMEEPNEQMLYGRTFGTTMGEVRWDQVAHGLGCAGFYADDAEGLAAALAAAHRSDRPAVVCVKTDRLANMTVAPDAALRFAEVYQGPI